MSDTVALAKFQPAEIAHHVAVDVTTGMTFTQMTAMGDELCRTGFLPEHVKNGVQFAAIVLDGRERGMLPMRAIRSLQMVKGKVCETADSQLARFKADGGRAKFTQLDEAGAVLWLRHPNGDEHTESWGPEDSKRAGLAGGMHGKFPKAMYRSRAITAGLKSLGWEGAIGTYDPSELDMDAIEAPPAVSVVDTAKARLEAEKLRDEEAARAKQKEADAAKAVCASIEVELKRLGVGVEHIASRVCHANGGPKPRTLAEYQRVLDVLSKEGVAVEREPGADDEDQAKAAQ